ncbi:MAG: sortase [Methanobrevibacter sp.]|jgi:LPXTG-site transpeptidase (sortase) family protein|nr:sortase [Methanobrevibacter sp.]
MKIRTIILILIIAFISIYAMQEVTYFATKEVNTDNFNGSTLVIPKINLTEHLYDSLDKGVLFTEGSSEPSKGTVLLQGHRTFLGSPFLRLDELVVGDNLSILCPGIGKVNYVVDNKHIENPDYRIVLNNKSNTKLYMSTCHPLGFTTQRLIIDSSFVDVEPLVDTKTIVEYTYFIIMIILGVFIVGSIISYLYPVKEDRKFLFAEIIIITLILIGLFIHPIPLSYFSFLGQLF